MLIHNSAFPCTELLAWLNKGGFETVRYSTGRMEYGALAAIEQVLNTPLIRQFKVGDYRIDGYDPENNIAYEIDEPHHNFQVDEDLKREEFIKSKLGCEFKRIKL